MSPSERIRACYLHAATSLRPPKPRYLIAAGLRPTNRLARWRTATGKGTLISNGTYETKNRPLWPLTVPLSPGSRIRGASKSQICEILLPIWDLYAVIPDKGRLLLFSLRGSILHQVRKNFHEDRNGIKIRA